MSEHEYPSLEDALEQGKSLSKEQIAAITDTEFLQDYVDKIEERIIAIETNLEFSGRDEEWIQRAIGALIYLRMSKKHAGKHLQNLKGTREENHLKSLAHLEKLAAVKTAEALRLQEYNKLMENIIIAAGKLSP